MAPPSGLLKAGTILLLVGAIVGAVVGFLMLVSGLVLGFLLGEAFILVLYAGLGLLVGVGSAFTFLAWRRAQAGNLHGAFTFGLVGALLPPVQVLPLLGAVLVKASPEGEAAAKGP
jgi:hypothetical protein